MDIRIREECEPGNNKPVWIRQDPPGVHTLLDSIGTNFTWPYKFTVRLLKINLIFRKYNLIFRKKNLSQFYEKTQIVFGTVFGKKKFIHNNYFKDSVW